MTSHLEDLRANLKAARSPKSDGSSPSAANFGAVQPGSSSPSAADAAAVINCDGSSPSAANAAVVINCGSSSPSAANVAVVINCGGSSPSAANVAVVDQPGAPFVRNLSGSSSGSSQLAKDSWGDVAAGQPSADAAIPDQLEGPYSIQLLGRRERPPGASGPVVYTIKLRGAQGEQMLYRRYSRFVQLREKLADLFPDIPEVPPKSFFRLMAVPGFAAERETRLRDVVVAVVTADPWANTSALREFLGLADPLRDPRKSLSSYGSYGSTSTKSLNCIEESEDEDEDDFVQVITVMEPVLESILSGYPLNLDS